MRNPKLHKFLKSSGPAACATILAIMTAVFLAAQTWPRLANYIESTYEMTPPVAFTIIAGGFAALFIAYVLALVYTGSPGPFKAWSDKSLDGLCRAIGSSNLDSKSDDA